MNLKNIAILTLSLYLSNMSFAQDAEEIVVTGIHGSEYSEMPSVTFKKKGDFLVQDVQLINDSRAPDLRRNEIIQTIKNIMASSKRIKGIELSYGDGFLVPINLDDNSLKIIDDKKSSDTSRVNISIKIAISEKDPAKVKIEELKKFLKSVNLVGRTLLEEEGDIGLSIINPEQYRYQILSLVGKENSKLKEVFGDECSAETDGISGRVEWDRIAVDELVLFIRFKTKITCK